METDRLTVGCDEPFPAGSLTLTVAAAAGVCSASEPERAEPAADESSVEEPPAEELPADEPPADEPAVPSDTWTLADAPDGLADIPAWTAGVVACTADDDELSCAEAPSEADPVTGATDFTADADAAPTVLVTAPTVPATVLVTAPTVPATALPTVPVAAPTVLVTAPTVPVAAPTVLVTAPTVPVTAVPTVPVTVPAVLVTAPTVPVTALPTVPVTVPTAPVTPCAASPTVVTVVPTVPSAVWLTWVTGPLVPTVTDTVVGVVVDEPGTGFGPVGGVGPEVIGRLDGVERVVDGDPAPLPLPPAGLRPQLPPDGRRRGGPAATG